MIAMAPLPFSYRVGVAIITNLLLVVAVCDKGLRGGSSEASPPTLLNPPSLDLPQGVSLISSFGQKDGLMEETPGRISVIGFAKDDHGGLPLGNGDVTASVWVSPTGAINIGIGKSDAWDANGQLYKVANISLSLEGSENPQELQPVNTTLFFRRGEIHVEIGGIVVQILVDQQRPIVWIRSTAPAGRARRLTATLHPLRTSQEAMEWFTQPLQFCQQRFSQVDEFLGLLEGPFRDGVGIRNSGGSSAWLADSLSMQGLEGAPVYDAVSNRTFGGVLLGSGLVPHTLGSVIGEVSSATVLQFHVRSSQEAPSTWLSELYEQGKAFPPTNAAFEEAQGASLSYWEAFWNRSHVTLGSPENETAAAQVNIKYEQSRYLDACDGRSSASPIKFNGRTFTFNTPLGPDYRKWGSPYWFQNTRHPYYAAMAAGDFDILHSLFPFYMAHLPLAKERTKRYFQHAGAYFPETMEVTGLYSNFWFGWGCKAPQLPWEAPQPWNSFIRYHFQGGVELANLAIDHYLYTWDTRHLQDVALPLADAILQFYAEHFPMNGHRQEFFPSQALETWQCPHLPPRKDHCVTDPTPDIAGLQHLLTRLLGLDADEITPQQRVAWAKQLKALPAIALTGNVPPTQGTGAAAPAVLPARELPPTYSNEENAELYAVFPYKQYHIGRKPGKVDIGRNTFHRRLFPCNEGWCTDVVHAASLGLRSIALPLILERAQAAPPEGVAFGAFAPDFQDYSPSADHFAVMRTALHEMILTHSGDDRYLYLFAAWPEDMQWSVSFKLHAPGNTVVEGKCENNTLQWLRVTPQTRSRDVVLLGCNGSSARPLHTTTPTTTTAEQQ